MADIGALCSAAIAGDVNAIAMLEMEAEKLDDKGHILHTEAVKGNTENVRFIVRNIANKKNLWVKLDVMNRTALHRAAYEKQADVLEVLIDGARQFFQDNDYPHKSVSSFPANDDKSAVSSFQAYIRQVDIFSATALSCGVMIGCLRCVKMLVETDPTDRHTNFQGRSPMYIAAGEGKNDIVEMICKTCTAPSLDGPGGSTALHAAITRLNKAKEKDTDMIRMIINTAKRSCTPPYGRFEDLFNQPDESGHTVLELAVIENQVNVVDLILKEDPAYQHSGPKIKHGLMRSIYKAIDDKNTDIVELLSKTYDGFGGFKGAAALILAMKRGDKDSVLLLLRNAKHLASFAEDEGWTPLHYAAYHGFDSILDTIIEAQKELGYHFVYEDKVQTPILVAAENGYTSTVILLLELWQLWPTSSSAYTAIDNNGQNILHLAAVKNKKEMIEGILKYCQEKYKDTLLKQEDANGDTPLHLLISHGCYIPQLIKHMGPNTMVKNKKNMTPRDMLYSSVDIIADQVKIKIALDDVQTNRSIIFWRKNTKKKIDIPDCAVDRNKREAKDVKFNEKAKDEKRAQMKKDQERYKKRTKTQIIVAALITTVTFTVGFTMPGGLRQSGEVNEGLVVLIKKAAFKAFMVSDALAFLLSTSSLFLYFLESMYEDLDQVSILNAASVGLNIVSVMAMMLTFITGTYVVLSHSPALAVTVCLIGTFFFIFVIVLLIKMVYDRRRQVKRNYED